MTAVERFKKAEERINKKGLLKFENFKPNGSMMYFLQFFFTYNGHYRTIRAKQNMHQCHRWASRSVEDIYRITKFYFPHVRLIDILAFVTEEVQNKKLSTWKCSTVRKQVYNKRTYSTAAYESVDDMGLNHKEYPELIKQLL